MQLLQSYFALLEVTETLINRLKNETMETIKMNTLKRNIFLTFATALVIFSLSSCAVKAKFLTSSVVPAAQGQIKVTNDKNNNYVIKIKISDLADPSRLLPPKNLYVVWIETNDAFPQNMGQVKTSTHFLSKQLQGSFETVSALKPSKVFITAEDDGGIQYPSLVVLSTDNF